MDCWKRQPRTPFFLPTRAPVCLYSAKQCVPTRSVETEECIMASLADIVIKTSRERVWSQIIDAKTHPLWVGQDSTTDHNPNDWPSAGAKFTRTNKKTGQKTQGEVLAMRPGELLKLRADQEEDAFITTEFHLLEIPDGCAVRVLIEVYDTGNRRHTYYPEMIDQQWQDHLHKLKSLCEGY